MSVCAVLIHILYTQQIYVQKTETFGGGTEGNICNSSFMLWQLQLQLAAAVQLVGSGKPPNRGWCVINKKRPRTYII